MKSLRGINTLFKAILKFCPANQLFKYLRQRYTNQQIKCLNKLIRTRGYIRTLVSKTIFIKANIAQHTFPKSVNFWIENSRACHSPTIERSFMHNEIEINQSMIILLKNKCPLLWQEVRQFLFFFDLLRFCRYLAIIDERKEAANQKKNERNLRLLFQHWLGNRTPPNEKNIVNLSDYKLFDTEELVPSHGLNFCLPPSGVNKEEMLAEFEVLYAQLVHHKSQSE